MIHNIEEVKQKWEADKIKAATPPPLEKGQKPPAEAFVPKEVPCPFKFCRHGYGVNFYTSLKSEQVSKYEGQWDKGFKHGIGHMIFPDGSEYKGSFVKDQLEGFGKYHWAQ